MTLSNLLLQIPKVPADTVSAAKLQAVTDSVKAHVGVITQHISHPDSLANITPSKVVNGIRNFDWSGVVTTISTEFISFAIRLMAAILIFYIGKFLISKVYNIVRALMIKKDVDRSLGTFILSFIKISLLFLLIIVVIGVIGIETSSFIAIFASAGVAIGMALSGTLQNFAGGVLILLIKPYKVGDYIVFGEFKGFVKEIQIFHTILTTYNNDKIVIPNGGLSTGTINNFSAEPVHRLEWRVAISYGNEVSVARQAILEIINGEELIIKQNQDIPDEQTKEQQDDKPEEKQSLPLWRRILHLKKKSQADWTIGSDASKQINMPKRDYTPVVALESMDDSAITLIVRAWCRIEDYWNALYNVNEKIYNTLPQRGIQFPFPQIDVHVKNQN